MNLVASRAGLRRNGSANARRAESGAMPSDDGFGPDDDKGFGPTGPTATEGNPEDPIQPLQFGPWMVAFQHCELLPQARISRAVSPRLRRNTRTRQAEEDRFDEHELSF